MLRDFDIIEESWHVLELEDKTIVKMKPVLLFIDLAGTAKSASEGDLPFELRYRVVLDVWAKDKLTATTEAYDRQTIKEHITAPNLAFKFLERGVSAYQISDGPRIRLTQQPTRFDRTDLANRNGEPIYLVDSETQVDAMDGSADGS